MAEKSKTRHSRKEKYPHLTLRDSALAQPFKAHAQGGGEDQRVPEQPRGAHGNRLLGQLRRLHAYSTDAIAVQRDASVESGFGLQIEFVGQPEVELAFQSLSNERKHIELLSVRSDGERTFANVFVPDGELAHFEKYLAEYLAEKKDRNGNPRDHRALIDTIQAIRAAGLKALWTDDPDLLPEDEDESFWWEIWLPTRNDREAVVRDFRKLAHLSGCHVGQAQFNFPERTVLLMQASTAQFRNSVLTLNCVAELRRAKETADTFDSMAVDEQREWAEDLLQRTTFAPHGGDVPHVCLLDSGANRGHPLIAPALHADDVHTVNPAWGTNDSANHGTGMAGLALFGDLVTPVASNDPIGVVPRLESVKLVQGNGHNLGTAELHAALFSDAVAQPEISFPARRRVFGSAVTATDYRDRGRPSSWSAAVDGLAADSDGNGEFPRLFILSAGNTVDPSTWFDFPDSASTSLIHDPGQAWNALTVGAFTTKTDTQNVPGTPIAAEGELSPFTSTSAAWDKGWPLKPDVVLEGGNAIKDKYGASWMSSLSLLTTNNEPNERLFSTFNATSAATALCTRIASQIMAEYPELRPESVRALIVHSAEWTDAMKQLYLPTNGKSATKRDYVNLIRHCGWGVPDVEQALWSASNSLTLLIEDELHPYKKVAGKGVISRDMNLHSLPWPIEALESLGPAEVEMRVTLSYFVEPNPSARGIRSKFHYPSHRLRFDIQRPLDASTEDFVARVNAAAVRDDDADQMDASDPNWCLGDKQRHRGSLHQDIWKGTAAELASRGHIAVYPAAGWWRTRPALQRYDLKVRYSLIVSIRTEVNTIDLYTPVAQQVPISV